jgi:histone H3/H4
MMTILSADLMLGDAMASIPNSAIKSMIKKYAKVSITDDGASAIAAILEKEAKDIAKFAVENAKRGSRGKVTKEDISDYILKKGTNES